MNPPSKILSIFIALTSKLAVATPITLHYVDRGPYAVTDASGEPTGLVATPSADVFRKAKVPFVWRRTPLNRQFVVIKENKGQDCAIGLTPTKSREGFSKFTAPVYIGQPFIAILNPRVPLKPRMTMDELLKKYTILVKENMTMGDALTAKVLASPHSVLTSVDSTQMVKMIARGRADFMMISNEEVLYHLKEGTIVRGELHFRELDDVKLRFARSFMCSKSVDDKTIQKLNAVIAKMHVRPAKYIPIPKQGPVPMSGGLEPTQLSLNTDTK